MADYTTPPSVSPSLKSDLDSFVNVVNANAPAIQEKLLFKGIQNSGVTPKVSLPPLIQLVNKLLIPTVLRWEGTWADHPKDSGGATMRGVTLNTFKNSFDYLFINTEVPQVKTAAQALNKKHTNWKNDNAKAKQFLYTICSSELVMAIFFSGYLSNENLRYPIAVMAEDPFLGYFLANACWWTGGSVYDTSHFDDTAKKMGWSGNESKWASWIQSLGNKTPELTTKFLVSRCNRLLAITSDKGSPGPDFRKGFMNRMLNDEKDSDLMVLVKVNELFNLNAGNTFQLTPAELEHLKIKAEIYKTLSIEFPV